jgi:dienelactone hydrolase
VWLAATGVGFGAIILLILVWARSREGTLPAPRGPYAVGRTVFDWVDSARDEPFGHLAGAKRELLVWLWYPALTGRNAQPGPYLPARWAEALQTFPGSLLRQRFASVRIHAVDNAPLAPAPQRFPVLILSTGYGRIPADYTTLAEDLASHGYAVAGIANPYSAPAVVFPDNRIVERDREGAIPEDSPAAEKAGAAKLVKVWAADIVSTMNQLEKLDAGGNSRFAGRLALDRIGLFGHSFGGAASAEACRTDGRCKAAIDLDGTPYGDVATAGLAQPFMFMLSEPVTPPGLAIRFFWGSRQAYDEEQESEGRAIDVIYRASANGYRLVVRGARHFDFTDSALLFEPLMKIFGMLGPIDGGRVLALTSDYVRAFFDRYLENADRPLLRGAPAAYPEVRVESHERASRAGL